MKLPPLLSALKTTFLTFNAKQKPKRIHYQGSNILVENDETVLDALLRCGHEIANGCRAGACQSCLLVADQSPPASAQLGLNDNQKALNYFLSCQCKPVSSLKIRNADEGSNRVKAEVISKEQLNPQVMRLRLAADLTYYPGQYATLWRNKTIARSYSMASHPDLDDYLEFHIKVLENGQFSAWAYHDLKPGDEIDIQGPMGQCIYAVEPQTPLLMAAIGTGLAPIYGIVKDAIQQAHRGDIHLVVGAGTPEGFYYVEELQRLAMEQKNLHTHFVCQSGHSQFAQQANLYEYCQHRFPDLNGHQIYLCGASSFVQKMKKQCFLSGASMGNIATDAFLTSPS